jgi:hypothetical protein
MNYFQSTYLNLLYKYKNSNKISNKNSNKKIDIVKITNNELFSNYTLIYKRILIILFLFLISFLFIYYYLYF